MAGGSWKSWSSLLKQVREASRERPVKSSHIQGPSQLQPHSSSSRTRLQPRSRTLSHGALGVVSTGALSLRTFWSLCFLWLSWEKHCIVTVTCITQKTSMPYLRELSKYKFNPVCVCPFVHLCGLKQSHSIPVLLICFQSNKLMWECLGKIRSRGNVCALSAMVIPGTRVAMCALFLPR